jgi:hypothetical protein
MCRAAREDMIMRHASTILAVLLLLAGSALANTADIATLSDPPAITPPTNAPKFVMPTEVLYDNGPFVTHIGTGVGGADESWLQTYSSMNTYGFGHQVYYGYMIADDFEVPVGETWNIEQITFFAYQSYSPTTSTITAVHFEIWNAAPPGGTVIFGDMVTNRMVFTGWTNCYRLTDYNTGIDTARPIMGDVCSPMDVLQLTEGTYWLVWQTDGSLSSGPWAPPITIMGQTSTGNGMQYTTSWAAVTDSGTLTPQGFPFIIEGTRGPVGVEATTWSAVKALYR